MLSSYILAKCTLSLSLSLSLISPAPLYWVTQPVSIKVTCACSGQANHHTDHALSTCHPRTPGPITADFLRLVFSTRAGSSSSAPVHLGCGLQALYSSSQKVRTLAARPHHWGPKFIFLSPSEKVFIFTTAMALSYKGCMHILCILSVKCYYYIT